jgi:hypothetical protein
MSCQCFVSEAPVPFFPGERERGRSGQGAVGEGGGLTCKQDPPNELISPDVVKVHDENVKRALPDLLPWHIEGKRFIKDRI